MAKGDVNFALYVVQSIVNLVIVPLDNSACIGVLKLCVMIVRDTTSFGQVVVRISCGIVLCRIR